MIQLDNDVYDIIKLKYVHEILEIISKKYTENSSKLNNRMFFDNCKVKDFFETNGELDNIKVESILLVDFVNIEKSNNTLIVNYLKTGQLIYYSDFSVEKELKKENKTASKANTADYRGKYVEKYNNDWIKKYLISHPNFKENTNFFRAFISDIKKEFIELSSNIGMIINYDDMANKKYEKSNLRHEIITSSKVTVCPYCNRQYISYYKKGNATTADLDHFYPKKKFPLFALSLYNFIPSCQVCNQRFKRDKMKNILYPFRAGFGDDAKFTIKMNEKTTLNTLLHNNTDFDLLISVQESSLIRDEIENSKELFNLEEIYEHHKSYVQELLIKDYIYSDTYLRMMKKTLKKMPISEKQLNAFLYNFTYDDKEDKNRILEKLTKDILKKKL